MKILSYLIRGIGPILVLLLFAKCQKEEISTQLVVSEASSTFESVGLNVLQEPQTRTPGLFNYNLDGNLVHNYLPGSASLFTYDDNQYARTKTLAPKNGYALLVVQGFGFDIPDNAKIENIYVKVRRFKAGKGSIKEYFSHLVRKRERLPVWWEPYGPRWADPNFFPATEGEVNYSEAGKGNNGGGGGNQPYEWTPTMVNDPQFGALFQILPPVGGSVVIYYDQVVITVQYSLP